MTAKQKKLALALFEIGAIKFGDFKLKLHEKHPEAPLSPIYIDLRILRRFPDAKKLAIDVYLELVKDLKFDLIADVPTAATALASSLCDRLDKGMITPRADNKTHGSGAKIDGLLIEDKGKVVVLIDDLVTQADSKLEAIDTLSHAQIKVNDVVVLIDREQGGKKQLSDKGFNLHSAFTLNQMLDLYLSERKINKSKFQDIKDRIIKLNNFLGL